MKTKILILTCWTVASISLYAQSFQWADLGGANRSAYSTYAYYDHIINICTDSEGNAYIGIEVDGYSDVMFGDTEVDIPSTEMGIGGAVLCYNCHGELEWYKFYFTKTPSYASWNPAVALKSLQLADDSILLVSMRYKSQDLLMSIDERGEIDTIQDGTGRLLLWINSKNQEIIEKRGDAGMFVETAGDRIYCRDDRDIEIFDMAGNRESQVSLDFQLMQAESYTPTIADCIVHEDRYYVLSYSEYPHIFGADTLDISQGSYISCFDKSGVNLWYRQWDSRVLGHYGNIAIDTASNTLYIAQGQRFAAYTLEGNTLFEQHINNPYMGRRHNIHGMQVLPNHRVALGGLCERYFSIGGVDNDTISGAYIVLFDSHVDRFLLCQIVPSSRNVSFNAFCVDNDNNIVFGGIIGEGCWGIFGNDTIRCRSNKCNTFFGKYGWPCGVEAMWPEPVGIENAWSTTATAAIELQVYPNPTQNGVWVERRTAPVVVDATGNGVENFLEEVPIENSPTTTTTTTTTTTATTVSTATTASATTVPATLTLRNSLGQTLQLHSFPTGTTRFYLPLDNLPQGIYLLVYQEKDKTPDTKKVIKK